MSLWQMLLNAGPLMFPIVICSIVSFALFIERISYFKSVSSNVYVFKSKVYELLKQNRIKDALIMCEQNSSPVAKMMRAAITKFGKSREEIKEALENEGNIEIALLERNVPILMMITHLTPMIGLLGTVIGLAVSFYTVQMRSAAMNPVTPADIAGGMWQALLTTIFGLIISILTMLAYNFCVARIGSFTFEMQRTGSEFSELLVQIAQSNDS